MERNEYVEDRALKGIVATNVLTLIAALWQDWSVLQLMWPFWMQSLIIGWYARQRMLKVPSFHAEGVKIGDRRIEPPAATQRQTANFFALHFGFFHVLYLLFLIAMTTTTDAGGYISVTNASSGAVSLVRIGHVQPFDFLIYLALGWGFLKSHRDSHREHVRADLGHMPKPATLMMLPYARILPMHLTIVLAIPLGGGLVWFFMLLKIVADAVMHKVEHRLLQSPVHAA